jgi:hypothetical protein
MILRYCEVFFDWIVVPMVKSSPLASGPRTGIEAEISSAEISLLSATIERQGFGRIL